MTKRKENPLGKTNPLALWSLGTAILLLAPIAVVLGLVAIIQIVRNPEKGDGMPFAIMGILLGGVFLPFTVFMLLQGPLPAFDGCIALQQEGAAELRLIAFLEHRYHDKHQRFGSFDDIGFKNPEKDSPYERKLISFDEDTFVARATGIGPMTGDIMEISIDRVITRPRDGCQEASKK